MESPSVHNYKENDVKERRTINRGHVLVTDCKFPLERQALAERLAMRRFVVAVARVAVAVETVAVAIAAAAVVAAVVVVAAAAATVVPAVLPVVVG